MDNSHLAKLLKLQQNILSKIALEQSLTDVVNEICLAIESLLKENAAKCSLLILQNDQLFHCASPSLDPSYCEFVDGTFIGDSVGTCGTAAYLNERIITPDILESPAWDCIRDEAKKFNIRSCWSTPVVSTNSTVLGTFAIYHDYPRSPSEQEIEIIDYFVTFSAIALEKFANKTKLDLLIDELSVSNEKLKAFTQVIPDLALVLTEDGFLVDIYGSPDNLFYPRLKDLINKNIKELLHKKNIALVMSTIGQTLLQNTTQFLELEINETGDFITIEGRFTPLEHYHSSAQNKRHVLWMVRDITQRKIAERRVEELVYYDPLTQLPNRRLLHERLVICIERIKRSSNVGALLFLDLDNFKRINDSLGHAAGDELLKEVASRLNTTIRKTDTLARVGGDEFVILLESLGCDLNDASLKTSVVAQKIQDIFEEKFQIGTSYFKVSGSVGICLIEGEHVTADNILKFADTAMYRSKLNGGKGCCFYDSKLQTMLDKQLELESDIVRAIEKNEFCAFFQPQLDSNENIVGGEALIRWRHPEKGLIPPCDFIPVAEQFGLIQSLQNIVLKDICKLLLALKAKNLINHSFNVSINVSPSQFKSSTLKKELLKTLQGTTIKPSQITLEITESMLSHNVKQTVEQMEELRIDGFSFSIDDFGTGYSCLSYLQEFPVKELKIDKSFIDKIFDDKSGFSIVETIINLANNLKIKVVAEGVETSEQFDILKSNNVDSLQGYFFAKPMPIEEYIEWHANKVNGQQ